MANINEYKRLHKPELDPDKTRFKQGYYIPQNKSKVIGDIVEYRSSWEYKLARWCDLNPNVIRWGCEIVAIKYRDRGSVDLANCRKYGIDPNDPSQWPVRDYFIDFYLEFGGKNYTGNPEDIKKLLIEVKPYKETQPPTPPADTAKLKDKKRFNIEAKKYATNMSKWEAARAYAQTHGAEFFVWTERTLRTLGVL